jgi:hypothetical protein
MNFKTTRFYQFTLGLIAIIFLSISCSDETPTFTPSINQFEIDSLTIGLINGAIRNNQDTVNGAENFEIVLAGAGITINGIGDVTGIGSTINFNLYSTSATEFTAGTYTFNEEINPGTISEVYAQINYDSSTPEDDKVIGLVGGQIVVTVKVDIYSLNFSFITSDNKTLKGFYKGSLQILSN